MKQEKAAELVRNYSLYTKQIRALKEIIGDSMSKCKGFSGKRGEVIDAEGHFVFPHGEEDSKGREKDMHLWAWYQPDYDEYENAFYGKITAEEHGQQCPHCYAAHLAIQQRKAARKSLGGVKAAMTRLGS